MSNFNKIKIIIISVISIILLLNTGGCSINLGGGGSSGEKKSQVSKDEVKSIVEEQIKSQDTKKEIQNTVKNATATEIMNTIEGKKAIQDQSKLLIDEENKRLLKSKDFQKSVEEALKKIMQTPEMKKKLDGIIKSSLIKSLQGGGSQQGGSQSSSSSTGSGGK